LKPTNRKIHRALCWKRELDLAHTARPEHKAHTIRKMKGKRKILAQWWWQNRDLVNQPQQKPTRETGTRKSASRSVKQKWEPEGRLTDRAQRPRQQNLLALLSNPEQECTVGHTMRDRMTTKYQILTTNSSTKSQ
jgi:hypothetical protein